MADLKHRFHIHDIHTPSGLGWVLFNNICYLTVVSINRQPDIVKRLWATVAGAPIIPCVWMDFGIHVMNQEEQIKGIKYVMLILLLI